MLVGVVLVDVSVVGVVLVDVAVVVGVVLVDVAVVVGVVLVEVDVLAVDDVLAEDDDVSAVTATAIRTVEGTLHVAVTFEVVGGVPSATVEVRIFSMMLIVVPAAPATTETVRSGVESVPGAIGPTVSIETVSAAGNESAAAVFTPSICVGPASANEAWSNVPPITSYDVARCE